MKSLTAKTYLPSSPSTGSLLNPIGEAQLGNPNACLPNEELKEIPQPKVNTNVMTINFEEIEKNSHRATGDPIRCERCIGYLSVDSKYDMSTKTWVCEFCGYPNILDLEEEDLPKHSIMTYIDPDQEVSSAPAAVTYSPSVIFCIDISGSMSSSSQCRTKFKYMRHQDHITRLESVKLAVDEQLEKLAKNSPNTKVGLVVFSDEVKILGDDTVDDHTLNCDLSNYNEILEEAKKLVGRYLIGSISETLPKMLRKLEEIDAQGTTALGPALLFSLGLVLGQSGSKIILCTDGQANVGIGEVHYTDNRNAQEVYEAIAELALKEGISICLVSLVEEECRLDLLAPCATKTGGNMVKIDPENLADDFAEFLSERIIAFNCTIAIKLHSIMKFVTINPSDIGADPSVLFKELGIVVPTLVFTFEYALKSPEELKQNNINITKLKKLPFQVLLTYIGPDKLRYCKVISKTLEVTNDREEASKGIDVNILAMHSRKKTGDLALQGRMREAQNVTASYRSLIKGNKEAENEYNKVVKPLEKTVKQETTTAAYSKGYRSDMLTVNITRTQKFPTKKYKS